MPADPIAAVADGGPLSHQWIAVEDEEPVADVLGWFSFASARAPQLMQRYFGQQQEVQYVAAGASFPVLPIPGGKPLAPADPTHVTTLEPQRPDLGARVIQANAAGKGELHLMAIGVNQYRTATMNLKYAARDAQAIADLFTSRGPALFSKLNIRTLVDAQATREGILNAVADTARNAKPEDTLIVFAAGHGAMVGQRYYFLPHDLERKAEMVADDIRAGGLPADELGEALAKVPARQRMLILDTCASGGALQLARGGVDPFSFRGAIERLGQDGSVFTIAASAAADEAQEIDALGHGLLTYCLLAGLNAVDSGPLAAAGLHGNRPDGLADVLEWFSYASGQVPRVSRDLLGIVQEVQSSGHGASFVVLPLRGTKTRP